MGTPPEGYVDLYAEAIDVYIANWYAIYYARQKFTVPSEMTIDAVALYIEAWSVPRLDCGGDRINVRVNSTEGVLSSGLCTDTSSSGWVYIDLDQEITLMMVAQYEMEFDVPTGIYKYVGIHLGTSDTAVGSTWLGNAFSGQVRPNMADIPFKLAKKIPALIEVDIDIMPGSDNNPVNLGGAGVVPVAILSSDTFDATLVDPGTVDLSGATTKRVGKGGKYLCHEEDVNADGAPDFVCQVYAAQITIDARESMAVLHAETFDGMQIRGEDAVRIVPHK